MPENLDVSKEKLIEGAKLVQITPTADAPDGYHLIQHNKSLKKDIVKHVINTLKAAGQIDYLKRSGLTGGDWRILVEVHYYWRRSTDVYGGSFHKDTKGQTVFVNLSFINAHEIAGPEYILNPRPVMSHDKNIGGSLPLGFLDDLSHVRRALPQPTGIEATKIPAFEIVSFIDEAIHHATPVPGGRTVERDDVAES